MGWLAAPSAARSQIAAGAGVQRRGILPRPLEGRGGSFIADGREGIVLNVFTEREWRRRGLAERLMREVLAWADHAGLERLVLHASGGGRRLDERLGFVPTNEMRYSGSLVEGRGR